MNLQNSSYREKDPLLTAPPRVERIIRPKRTERSSRSKTSMKKSVGLLRAYGEYQRFLDISKQFLKERGIRVPGTLSQSRRRRRRPKTGREHRKKLEESSPGDDRKYEEMDKLLDEKLQDIK